MTLESIKVNMEAAEMSNKNEAQELIKLFGAYNEEIRRLVQSGGTARYISMYGELGQKLSSTPIGVMRYVKEHLEELGYKLEVSRDIENKFDGYWLKW